MKLLYSFLCIAIATSSAFAKISHADLERGRAKGLRLISLEDGADPVWKTQDEKLDLVRNRVGFFDVTEVYESEAPPNCQAGPAHAPYPAPSKQTAVRPIIDRLSLPSIQQYVQTLIQFKNRDAAEDAGVEASNYILAMVQNIISRHPPSGATVELFPHSFKQPSVIAKIPGTSNGPITIITAHVDTFNPDVLTDPNQGADSDATGSATLIEAINALLASGFRPSRPVEFHWYAAQFMGNLGSLQISKNYKDAGKQVHALLNIDAAAYVKPGTEPVFGLVPNYADPALINFVRSLIQTYSTVPPVDSNNASLSSMFSLYSLTHFGQQCTYACSDHASWYCKGYPTVMPAEGRWSDINPFRGTQSDFVTVPGFSWAHVHEFAKVAASFVYELGNA